VPELPEVETVVRDLRPLLEGKRLLSAGRPSGQALRRPWQAGWEKRLAGKRVRGVRRRGKWIVVELEGEEYLVFHLGMTGQLTVTGAAEPVADHTHLVFDLGGKGKKRQLRFRDARRFGSATLLGSPAELDAFFEGAGLGPEPFGLGAGHWRRVLAGTTRCLKAVLLDQRAVAGVGNIYADEALFEARLHPARRGCDLTAGEASRLARAVEKVLQRAVALRGSSIRDYVGGSGLRGGYQEEFRVYGRTGAPCPRCGTPVACMRLAGRATHYCPSCQLSAISRQPKTASGG
jgi:formamidopyrimidine-DNA glycosylase